MPCLRWRANASASGAAMDVTPVLVAAIDRHQRGLDGVLRGLRQPLCQP